MRENAQLVEDSKAENEANGEAGQNEKHAAILTDSQSLFESSEPYAVREGEQTPVKFEIAQAALDDLDRAGTNVSTSSGGIDGSVRTPASTVALAISPDLIHQGVVDLKGYRVSSSEDLATLAPVYRDQRFETFRMIYVKGNQIVGHEGVTSRLPAVVQLFNRVGGFLAMQYHGRVYVLMDSERHGFVQMAGHELLHHIKKESPDLYDWFSEQATRYMRDHSEADYRSRLHATGTNIGWTDVREEILADFTGDALADPRFLDHLAQQNPSKFQQFLNTVVDWLKSVAQKMSKAGFGS